MVGRPAQADASSGEGGFVEGRREALRDHAGERPDAEATGRRGRGVGGRRSQRFRRAGSIILVVLFDRRAPPPRVTVAAGAGEWAPRGAAHEERLHFDAHGACGGR